MYDERIKLSQDFIVTQFTIDGTFACPEVDFHLFLW